MAAIFVQHLRRMLHIIPLGLGCLLPFHQVYGQDQTQVSVLQHEPKEYIFDPSLLRGTPFEHIPIERLNIPQAEIPGIYRVDLWLNGKPKERTNVEFIDVDGKVQPCIPVDVLLRIGVPNISIDHDEIIEEKNCAIPVEAIGGASTTFILSTTRLMLDIPQHQLKGVAVGYIDPSLFDDGETMAAINYRFNQYHSQQRHSDVASYNSTYLNLDGGVNLGAWRFRHQSNWTRVSGRNSDWDSLNTYVQRALPVWKSELTLGDTATNGRLFPGVSGRGVMLMNDDRMLPDSMQGYAPIVRGVARTNARVEIFQNNNKLYETTVAPGVFEINDLLPLSNGNDLDVVVTEADGSISRFAVPFASIPLSLRPGRYHYSAFLGVSRDVGDDDLFAELTLHRGITNEWTAYGGLRFAKAYQNAMLGVVYTRPFGAFGLDATFSNAGNLPEGDQRGWQMRATYSHTIQATQTYINIAGYRYSTKGYRDLADVLDIREYTKHDDPWTSTTWKQRNRFEISAHQRFGDRHRFYLSGVTQDYYEGRDSETSYQLGYALAIRSMSFDFSVRRQKISSSSYYRQNNQKYETSYYFSFSMPFGTEARPNAASLTASADHTKGNGSIYRVAVNGTADREGTLYYNVGVDRDTDKSETGVSGNIDKKLPWATVGVAAAQNNSSRQASASARGALLVHDGGVTFGPWLSETFALIEAKGASGARVIGGEGSIINARGYALKPSLQPYRVNNLALDPKGMNFRTELLESEHLVVPYAGAAIKRSFKTQVGYAMLIRAYLPNGDTPPAGSLIFDENQQEVGMIAQNGQSFVRVNYERGPLLARWGQESENQCVMSFDVAGAPADEPLIQAGDLLCQYFSSDTP